MTGLDRLAPLPDAEVINLWNGAGTVERVVVRVGRLPRRAVVARAVALRKAGNAVKTLGPATASSASPSAA